MVQYRFVQLNAPQGHAGDVFLESAFAIYVPHGTKGYEVGKEYELALEVQ